MVCIRLTDVPNREARPGPKSGIGAPPNWQCTPFRKSSRLLCSECLASKGTHRKSQKHTYCRNELRSSSMLFKARS
ncbi:hypothetical protein K443DRAFT_374828 [Laccaria amethystina LaAM-08-1]|uniref:Uncharacterized protein n=1 Tax=Laccaria amethystina LaAM-08-1 TaxID=1095629 RepID=A0A0C9Y4R7_9AGAR|nr:hypothetical protein K443DRAFT_374828 [Laccaria amethystina LaAM-08-1]